MKWGDRINVKKGCVGENIVDNYIHKTKNMIPYNPVFDGPHPFDRIIASLDKKEVYILDIKSKARRTYYPDTGIDRRHYNDYKHIEEKYNMNVYIAFVDEALNKVYGNFLHILEQKTQIIHNGRTVYYPLPDRKHPIIYFPCKNMEFVCSISSKESEELKKLSCRNHEYPKMGIVKNKKITTLFDF